MTGREKFNKYKYQINLLCSFFRLFGKSFNYKLFVFCRNINGNKGMVLRYVFAKNIFKNIGDNVSIHPCVFILNPQNILIGNNVSIHPMCYIEGAGGVEIGNNVSIAHSTSMISSNHSWGNNNIPIKYNPEIFEKITIEDDVWIASGVRILSGVKISKRTIVAAGAVVNKSFENNMIIGGVPAKSIRKI